MSGLTPRQRECLDAIVAYDDQFGASPSYDELKDRLNLGSKSTVFRIVDKLEERGFVRRLRYRARAIEILVRPKVKATKPTLPTPADLDTFNTPQLLDLLAHVCGLLGYRLGPAKVRETLDRIGNRLAGGRG